jgi:hypothetical protein
MARKGDLSPGDGPEAALADTRSYQRSHADAFSEALRISPVTAPDAPLAVVDIGAGACTVAVAMSECWGASVANVRYHAVEPHPTMRRLGTAILSEGGWEGQLVEQVESLDDLSNHAESRLLVTLSYVVHQSQVTEEDVSALADFIADQTDQMERDPEVLITTVISGSWTLLRRWRTPLLRSQLEERGVQVEETAESLLVGHRFPTSNSAMEQRLFELKPEAHDWPIAWIPWRPSTPNVRVCHWRVSNG